MTPSDHMPVEHPSFSGPGPVGHSQKWQLINALNEAVVHGGRESQIAVTAAFTLLMAARHGVGSPRDWGKVLEAVDPLMAGATWDGQ